MSGGRDIISMSGSAFDISLWPVLPQWCDQHIPNSRCRSWNAAIVIESPFVALQRTLCPVYAVTNDRRCCGHASSAGPIAHRAQKQQHPEALFPSDVILDNKRFSARSKLCAQL